MTQRLERKLQKTFENPYKVFTYSDKREENDKLTPNREGQKLLQRKNVKKSKQEMINP
jgi:hypothetical protein